MKAVIDSGEWDAGHNMYMKKIDISVQTIINEKTKISSYQEFFGFSCNIGF